MVLIFRKCGLRAVLLNSFDAINVLMAVAVKLG